MRFVSRAQRWAMWTASGLAVLVSLFVLVLPWSTRYLVDRIAVLLSDRYDIDFSAGRVEFALSSLSFTLHDVRLATRAVPHAQSSLCAVSTSSISRRRPRRFASRDRDSLRRCEVTRRGGWWARFMPAAASLEAENVAGMLPRAGLRARKSAVALLHRPDVLRVLVGGNQNRRPMPM